ncbi:OVARIAN TUMOR DOMAIN-containing deubiquitinating enzyme 9 [Picochlorum sp. SENEW3]|nr:OVARIAN TUMOR DOMAIN-containing deubiquitinating enzyme 9 [Picochlorum sp. SENEW3]
MSWCWCFRHREVDPPYMDAALSSELDTKLRSIAKPETVGKSLLVNVSFRDKQTVSFRKLEPISDADLVHLDWTESRQLLEEAIQVNTKDPSSGGELLPDDDLRLAERLRGLGLEVDVQAGDGNCQFRSLAKQIFRNPEKHGLVRSKAVRYIRLNRQRFLPYLGPEFDTYVKEMSVEGCWGDELTLRAASEAFHCMISCITMQSEE